MADRLSIEQLLAEIDREVAALPPGSDVAGYITRRHRELGELLARRVAETRQAASSEAAFPPSGMPGVRAPGDAAGGEAAPEDVPPAPGRSPPRTDGA